MQDETKVSKRKHMLYRLNFVTKLILRWIMLLGKVLIALFLIDVEYKLGCIVLELVMSIKIENKAVIYPLQAASKLNSIFL